MPLFAFDRLYKKLGRGYFWLFLVFYVLSAYLVALGTLALFALYQDMSSGEFWRIMLFTDLCVGGGLLYGFVKVKHRAAPLMRWMAGGKSRDQALEAWRTAVALPRDFVVETGLHPFVIVAVPTAIFFPIELGLPFYSAIIVFAGALVAVAYAAILHFFAAELFLRPVVQEAGEHLPHELTSKPTGVPLRWKLLGALPIINVITGVVVSGLSTDGRASLEDLGLDVLVALAVAFSISLELTVLVTKSVLRPIDDLLEATGRVQRGDLDARVPVTSGDEMAAVAASFNEMMKGLSEREALREAFGSYVDPGVAERVLEEGELLEGQDREVTVMFVDVRDFTSFAEQASARETVSFLNDFFDLVVPIVLEHGGHANKFLGDGVLAVFGAPQRVPDHADRALEAARAVARAVEERFGDDVKIGIGLNSGPVVVGSVGGGGRLEFAVIGDPVNVAARVEDACRDGDCILLTEATRCLLERTAEGLEDRGEIPLKGKSDPVAIYAARARLDGRSSAGAQRLIAEA